MGVMCCCVITSERTASASCRLAYDHVGGAEFYVGLGPFSAVFRDMADPLLYNSVLRARAAPRPGHAASRSIQLLVPSYRLLRNGFLRPLLRATTTTMRLSTASFCVSSSERLLIIPSAGPNYVPRRRVIHRLRRKHDDARESASYRHRPSDLKFMRLLPQPMYFADRVSLNIYLTSCLNIHNPSCSCCNSFNSAIISQRRSTHCFKQLLAVQPPLLKQSSFL